MRGAERVIFITNQRHACDPRSSLQGVWMEFYTPNTETEDLHERVPAQSAHVFKGSGLGTWTCWELDSGS